MIFGIQSYSPVTWCSITVEFRDFKYGLSFIEIFVNYIKIIGKLNLINQMNIIIVLLIIAKS